MMFSFRMGALDVCPFIPISGVTEEECVQVSKNFGARLGEEVQNIYLLISLDFHNCPVSGNWSHYNVFQLSVPVFLYGSASTREYRYNVHPHPRNFVIFNYLMMNWTLKFE